MKADFLFAGLNLSTIVYDKNTRQIHVLWLIHASKTKSINYLHVGTRLLFGPPVKSPGYAPVPN